MSKKYRVLFSDERSSLEGSLAEIKQWIEQGKLLGNEEAESLELGSNEKTEKKNIRDFPEIDEFFLNLSSPEERTQLKTGLIKLEEEERTRIFSEASSLPVKAAGNEWADTETKSAETAMIQRPESLTTKDSGKRKFGVPKKSLLILILLALVVYEFAMEEDAESPSSKGAPEFSLAAVRPTLPATSMAQVDPAKSMELYQKAMKFYMEDTVPGYKKAEAGYHWALRADPQNVRALAMLASTYINLFDSSNKDENTYSVISKLIELSRYKEVDLSETLMAEVEFLSVLGRYDSGIQKLVNFYKVTGKLDPVLYFELAWLSYLKGDYGNALKYVNQIPASALPIPKLYFLRGRLFEASGSLDEASAEYQRAIKINPQHAKSILGLIRISDKKGELKDSIKAIQFLYINPELQSPDEYVELLQLRSKGAQLFNQPKEALVSLQAAIKIQPRNENIRLSYYSLLAGQSKNEEYKNIAQMYALVLEAGSLAKSNQGHEALLLLIRAKDAYPQSIVPREKMGELFMSQGEFEKAQNEFKKALEIDPKQGDLAIKLINAQIKSNNLDDAQKVLLKYRSHPKLKSAIDRLAGDLAYQQRNFVQAVSFYRKAMSRDSIDPDVYSSYATVLGELDQCKDAQFFYRLAQRLDPSNYAAISGSAKCFLKTDGINEAVARVQEELSRLPQPKAELLTLIAELYYINGNWDKALSFIDQSKEVSFDYPEHYRIEGELYLKQLHLRKDAQRLALEAWKAYSDRKPTDPTGYLKRFELFLKDAKFEEAQGELARVFEISPRYPGLHLKRGLMFSKMGRTKDAIVELEEEVKLNPRSVPALVELGNLEVRLNRLDSAMGRFVQAMELDPRSASAKLGAGYVNFLKRQFSSALALYSAALSLDKGNPDIYKKMGQAYKESGDQQKAAKAFRSYLDLAPDAPDRKEYEQYR